VRCCPGGQEEVVGRKFHVLLDNGEVRGVRAPDSRPEEPTAAGRRTAARRTARRPKPTIADTDVRRLAEQHSSGSTLDQAV
jgi:hypothetical protein